MKYAGYCPEWLKTLLSEREQGLLVILVACCKPSDIVKALSFSKLFIGMIVFSYFSLLFASCRISSRWQSEMLSVLRNSATMALIARKLSCVPRLSET